MEESLRVLLIEDDEQDAELVRVELEGGGFDVQWNRVDTEAELRRLLTERVWDIIIADYSMPRFDGLRAFEIVREMALDIPFIFVSGVLGEERAVGAMRAGARDYLLKGNLGRLNAAVRREIKEAANRRSLRETQERLSRHAEALERSNADLEQFAYIASHDLQEPLRMVASYTELLAQRYQGQLDEKADKFIGYAVEGAKRMQQLVNDLLAYSRVGTQEIKLKPTDANAVVAQTLRELTSALESAGGEVTLSELPTVTADPVQLGRVFQNLIANAIKFRAERPLRIHVSAERKKGLWRFSVRDNGIGLASEFSEQIFQMFRRLHDRGKYDGNGIGLAISKRVVERLGGQIWCESEVDKGTTFHFTLPAADVGDKEAP